MIDKLKIVTTIKFKDIISRLGREQVAAIVSAQIRYYIKYPSDASDGGKNWEKGYDSGGNWICDNLVIDSGTLYCSLRDESRNGVTVKSGRIMPSTDYGTTWKDLFLLDAEVRQPLVTNRIIGVQLYSASGNK